MNLLLPAADRPNLGPMSLGSILSELKRRRVYRVVAVYAVAACAIIEFADLVLSRLGAPELTVTFVIVVAIIGLPIAIALAWMFDLTGDGFRRTPDKS